MLVTISGIVGSGKSTTAAIVMECLEDAKLEPRYLRFRYLRLFGSTQQSTKRPTGTGAASPGPRLRSQGFTLRRLTAILTLGYISRIVSFRLSGVGGASRCDVVDRYFYDNLAHYRLSTKRERLYVWILRRLIPMPDLAIVVLASDETLVARRTSHAREYLVTVGGRYRRELLHLFPNLVAISTDPGATTQEDVRRAVRAAVERSPRPSNESVVAKL